MTEIPKQVGPDEVVFSGNIFEIIHRHMQSGETSMVFEIARRSPGTRLIIIDKEKNRILLTKEFRYEISDFDLRLPGGKVCDRLEEFRQVTDIKEEAQKAAIREARQEAGIVPENISLYTIAKTGGPTVAWDLFYYVIDKFTVTSQDLEFGENIAVEWFDISTAINLCLEGRMKDYRSLGVLMTYLHSIGKI